LTQLEPKDGGAPVRLLTKIALLCAILAIDLLFFFVLPTYFPETFDAVFQMTAWPDVVKTFAIFSGLAIAVLSSSVIVYILVQRFRKTVTIRG
jgi:hypothetical protein